MLRCYLSSWRPQTELHDHLNVHVSKYSRYRGLHLASALCLCYRRRLALPTKWQVWCYGRVVSSWRRPYNLLLTRLLRTNTNNSFKVETRKLLICACWLLTASTANIHLVSSPPPNSNTEEIQSSKNAKHVQNAEKNQQNLDVPLAFIIRHLSHVFLLLHHSARTKLITSIWQRHISVSLVCI